MAATAQALHQEIDDPRARLTRTEARNARLESLLVQALQLVFGPSREKVSAEQSQLFDDEQQQGGADASVAEPDQVEGHSRRRRSGRVAL